MKRCCLIFVVLSTIIVGLFSSCACSCECYDFRCSMPETHYCDTCNNSARDLAYEYISHPMQVYDSIINEWSIFSEDNTVLDQEIRVYGWMTCSYDGHNYYVKSLDPVPYNLRSGLNIVYTIGISFDTTDHVLFDKIRLMAEAKDTVNIKGRLRLYTVSWGSQDANCNCICDYNVAGVFIDSADDIALTSKRDEEN